MRRSRARAREPCRPRWHALIAALYTTVLHSAPAAACRSVPPRPPRRDRVSARVKARHGHVLEDGERRLPLPAGG
eukprot:5513027-Pyramimonas_sp.AAC.1